LLINFWTTRLQANKAAMKALIVNRVGDFGVYFAMVLVFYVFETFDFMVIYSCSETNDSLTVSIINMNNMMELIGFMFLLGAVAKSAQ